MVHGVELERVHAAGHLRCTEGRDERLLARGAETVMLARAYLCAVLLRILLLIDD
jgi:hypothetical protein